MGIITRLLHRSEGLSPNRFNAFLFDTGENIHLHYRDLRVEFSVDEFMEFHDLCLQYLPQLKQFIDSGYRDGVHPNTNQSSTWRQFTTRKPLVNTIRYHPVRISLEENSDGYHVHIRNYKILLDKPSFLALAAGARDALGKRETEVDVPEALELLTVNELPNRVDRLKDAGIGWEALAVVERAYFRKACQVLEAVGFRQSGIQQGATLYTKAESSIRLRAGSLGQTTGPVTKLEPLDAWLRAHAERTQAEEFTRVKLQILDTVGRLRQQGREGSADLRHDRLFYDSNVRKVVLPARLDDAPQSSRDCLVELERFAAGLGIRTPKPPKLVYADEEQRQLELAFERFLAEKIVSEPCVRTVYRFGGAGAGKGPGVYELPYVHFDWVKLGSDFDLLVEIDEAQALPSDWEFKFHWDPAGSGYYHLGDVDHPIQSPFIREFPGIDFRHHLVEAYVFLPSRGDAKRKDEFLAKHAGRCIFSRDTSAADDITAALKSAFGLGSSALVSAMPSPGFNRMYHLSDGAAEFVAKLMDRRDFTPALPGHRGKHLNYEAEILSGMRALGSRVAVLPVPGSDGQTLQLIGDRTCMLFPFVASAAVEQPTVEHIRAAATALAEFHRETSKIPEGSGAHYTFETLLDYELSHLRSGIARARLSPAAASLQPVLAAAEAARESVLRGAPLSRVHCHGDVCPRNFFFTPGGAILHDYQMFAWGPRLADVAEGALEFGLLNEAIDLLRVRSFIDGYHAKGSLDTGEIDSLPWMLVLQCAFRLARMLRVSLDFGYPLNERRMRAFADFAESLGRGEFPDSEAA